MLLIRNTQTSVLGSKLDLRLKNGEISQLRTIIDNLASTRSSSTANNQPKEWMARYESFLSRRYPKVYAVHKMVTNGCKWCWSDIKTYYQLKKDLRTNTRQVSELKRSELEILLQVNRKVSKKRRVIIISWVSKVKMPFGNNAYNHTISATSNTGSGRESLRAVTCKICQVNTSNYHVCPRGCGICDSLIRWKVVSDIPNFILSDLKLNKNNLLVFYKHFAQKLPCSTTLSFSNVQITKEELLKLAVIVILIPLPFSIYIFALAVVFFPQLVLTRHFWTNDQRKRFWSISLKRTARLHINPLRKYLQNLDVNLQTSLEELKKLELPEMNTYSLGHLYHLSRLHRVGLFTGGVRGFHDRAEMLRHLDYSLRSDDTTIDMMSEQQLCEQFYLRRLQYDGLSKEKMKCLLKNWIQHMTDPCLKTPLFLHAPVFETALKNAAEDLKPIQKC